MWKYLHKLVAGVAAVSFGLAAGAQDLPAPPSSLTQRPIELVVPWGTGGGSDQMARALAQAMEKLAPSVKVAVVNKPGGNGTLGLTHALSQPANGRSLALITNDFLINHVSGSASIKPDDFEYVGRVVADVEMLFARSGDGRFPNFAAYVKEAKAKKHGGKAMGGKSMPRADRMPRKAGGRTGSNMNPLSSAHAGTAPKGRSGLEC